MKLSELKDIKIDMSIVILASSISIGMGIAILGMSSCEGKSSVARYEALTQNRKDVMEHQRWIIENGK